MQTSIAVELVAAVSEKGFSLDELVLKVRQLFENQGMAGVIALVLKLVDEMLSRRMVQGEGPGRDCCGAPCYELHDRLPRRFRTAAGEVHIEWRRLRCRACGKTKVPLRDFLGLSRWQSKSTELEQMVVEVICDQSYRRGSRHLRLIGQIPVPKSTAHRWVEQSPCDELEEPPGPLAVVMADSTGYKRRPDNEKGLDNRGDLRMAIGITQDGEVVPLGTWSGDSWEAIGRQLGELGDEEGTVADVLVSDGEPGLPQSLGPLTEGEQRCHWHTIHDLDERMRKQGAPIGLRRAMQKELAALLELPLPVASVEEVSAAEKGALWEQTETAEARLSEFVASLAARGYDQAARYVRRAKDRLFTYVRFWLTHGVVSPRACSLIERIMRELARRLKRIAFGWRPQNAAKMARILLKRLLNHTQWEAYWRDRLRIKDNVLLALRRIVADPSPQVLGR